MPLIQVSVGAPWPRTTNYIAALEAAGAETAAGYCPPPDLSCGGLLLGGGADIDPGHYGEPPNGSLDIDNARDMAELTLIQSFMRAGKPIFGICRGSQLINVALGGSLIQHLLSSQKHTAEGGPDLVHGVIADEMGIAGRLFGGQFAVNSSHHQAISRLAPGLIETARSEEDGMTEAFEHENLPIFGVQWHPERMCLDHLRPDTPDMLPLFEYFVSLCK